MSPSSAVRLFVVDHSAIVRQCLQQMLRDRSDIVLVGSAPTPQTALPAVRRNPPDVLLLDLDIPGVDVPAFLRRLRDEMSIPAVLWTGLGEERSAAALAALAAGGVAVLGRPRQGLQQFLLLFTHTLVQTLEQSARMRLRPVGRGPGVTSAERLVLIGASTGGTQAIEAVLRRLPEDSPGIVIVQHMPEKFTAMYAQRLDSACAVRVREARNGDRVERGLALVAPGGRHLQLRRADGPYFAVVGDGPPVNRHKPSVDVLFQSVADCAGAQALAILLTGMGNDGARGMKQLHDRGARTVAQDEKSCTVFGMPMEAIRLNGVDEVLPLSQVAEAITRFDRGSVTA